MKEKLGEGALQYGTKVAAVSIAIQLLLWPIPFIGPSMGSFFVSSLTSSGFVAYMGFDGWRRDRRLKKTRGNNA